MLDKYLSIPVLLRVDVALLSLAVVSQVARVCVCAYSMCVCVGSVFTHGFHHTAGLRPYKP